jgi:hypothetical protein
MIFWNFYLILNLIVIMTPCLGNQTGRHLDLTEPYVSLKEAGVTVGIRDLGLTVRTLV